MKRLIVLGIVVFLCLPLFVYAASIGGVETQGQGKFSISLDQEFVFDRDMKDKKEVWQWDPDGPGPAPLLDCSSREEVEIDKMYRTMVKVSYGVLDNFDVYLKLGTADFESKAKFVETWSSESMSDILEESQIKIKGDNAFAYGFGAKGTYDLENDWLIGVDVQYLRHKNDFKGTESWTDYDYDAAGNRIGSDSGTTSHRGKVTFQAWHIAPYIAKKLGSFLPYLGVKYSSIETKLKGTYTDPGEPSEDYKVKFRAEDHFGVFLGTDYKVSDVLTLNFEARFIDETAISFGGTYRF